MFGLRHGQSVSSSARASTGRVLVVPVTCRLRPIRPSCSSPEHIVGPINLGQFRSNSRDAPLLSGVDRLTASAAQAAGTTSDADQQWAVVNFYHLVDIPDPEKLVQQHRKWVEDNGFDVRGRIYYSHQGVNAQFGGTVRDATAYLEYVKSQPLFQGLRYTVWPATGQMFPKLRLKVKPNLISLAGGMEGLPVTDPSCRATPLEPKAWKEMIAQRKEKGVIVLDVRNDYEWDAGHFDGAERPAEEEFAETPVGEDPADVPGYLKGQDPNAPVMMYCTGGIRCDVYSAFLRKHGFNNLYTLEGGIQNYLVQEGANHWKGSLYVFDGRMALPPTISSVLGGMRQLNTAQDHLGAATLESQPLPAAVPCQVCGSPDSQLPHMNCANIDCNELFIACAACKTRYSGCCCQECMDAPRLLRPAKLDGGNYGAWGNYADEESIGRAMSTGRNHEGRVARRARRRAAMKERRTRQADAEAARKKVMKEAVAQLEAQQRAESSAAPASELQQRIAQLREKLQRQQQGVAQ